MAPCLLRESNLSHTDARSAVARWLIEPRLRLWVSAGGPHRVQQAPGGRQVPHELVHTVVMVPLDVVDVLMIPFDAGV